MNRKTFKRCVRLIYNGTVPVTWADLHKEYEASLWTAPVPDNEKTAKEFLMNSFQFGLQTTTAVAVCDTPPPVKKLGWKVPATSLTVADVNRALDMLQEGNNPMCYNNSTKTEAQTQRDYLERRLTQVACEKRESFNTTFRTDNPDQPTTYKELIDAIKNGDYTLNEKQTKQVDAIIDADERYYGGPWVGIKWNLKNAPDWDGYNKANTEAEKQRTVAKDAIMSGVYADGLKAIQDFEAWQPTGKAN